MNRDQLKKNVGFRVRLRPTMRELDQFGRPFSYKDDDWLIQVAGEAALNISNLRTQHIYALGYDHIHHFVSDPDKTRGGLNRGMLVLTVQLVARGNGLDIEPTIKPGTAMAPSRVLPLDKLVDYHYPSDIGLVADLQSQGYQVMWARRCFVPRRIELEGWERVTVRGVRGRLIQFRTPSPAGELVLLRRFLPQQPPKRQLQSTARYFS
jgi:hypothetical protein